MTNFFTAIGQWFFEPSVPEMICEEVLPKDLECTNLPGMCVDRVTLFAEGISALLTNSAHKLQEIYGECTGDLIGLPSEQCQETGEFICPSYYNPETAGYFAVGAGIVGTLIVGSMIYDAYQETKTALPEPQKPSTSSLKA